MEANNCVYINCSLSKPKQPVRKVLEDIDALLEELLEEDSQQLKVNYSRLDLTFILKPLLEKITVCEPQQRPACLCLMSAAFLSFQTESEGGSEDRKRSCQAAQRK